MRGIREKIFGAFLFLEVMVMGLSFLGQEEIPSSIV
jgi:hypothetical protein